MANGAEGDAHSWLELALHGATVLLGLITGAWAAAWRQADRLRKRDDEIKRLIEETEKRQTEQRNQISAKIDAMHKEQTERQDYLHRENIKRHDALRAQLSAFDRALGQIEGRQESAERRRRERASGYDQSDD